MTTSGWSANGTALVSIRCGGVPMIATSISLRSSSRTMTSRLFTDSVTLTPGNRCWNRASSAGAKYLAVLTTPTLIRPPRRPLSAEIAASASFSASRICRA